MACLGRRGGPGPTVETDPRESPLIMGEWLLSVFVTRIPSGARQAGGHARGGLGGVGVCHL